MTGHTETTNNALILQAGEAQATLLPDRGGLLSELSLMDPQGDVRPVLWQPGDFEPAGSGWPGGGLPLLFPFAGRSWHEGKVFRYVPTPGAAPLDMPLHGFAYAQPWETVIAGQQEAVLMLRSSEESRKIFPFTFTVTATYRLTERELECRVAIKVPEGGEMGMPVAAGFHPYFAWPPEGRGGLGHLHCEATEAMPVTAAGAAGKAAPGSTTFDLDDPLNQNRILAGLKNQEARLENARPELPDLRLVWSGPLKYMVLWSAGPDRTFSVEPWMGLPDAVHTGLGLVRLDPGDGVEIGLRLRWE